MTARDHIVARRHGLGYRNWDDAGPAHGVRHLATGGRRLYGVGPSKDLRVGTVVADPFDTLNALLAAPPARLALADGANDYRYLDLVFSTRDPANCFVRRRWEVPSRPEVEDINMAGALDFYTKIVLHDDLRTGVLILAEALPGIVAGSLAVADIAVQTAPLPPDIKLIVGAITSIFAGSQAINVTQAAADLRAVAADPEATLGAVLAVALNLLERSELERVVPQLSAAVSAFAYDQVRG